MSVLSRLAAYIVSKASGTGGAFNIAKWQENRPYYPEVSHQALVDRYAGWVYTCSNKNAIGCAQVPLRLYAAKPNTKTKALFPTKKPNNDTISYLAGSPTTAKYLSKAVEVEEVLDHPFLTLMQQVNGYMNQFDLLEGMFLWQELTGNAYWYLLRENENALPSEIWPMMPQRMKIIPSKETFISHYEFSVSAADKVRYETADIIHFKYANPRDAFYGLGPLQAAAVAADLSASMNAFEVGLLKNRAQPDCALILPEDAGNPNEDMKERMYKEWNKRFGGVRKGGKMAILHGGADLKQISLSPKDMAYLQGRKATLNEIASIFGVPMSKLTTEDVNRANAQAGDYSYMKDTILPRLRKVEQKLNEQLLPIYDERLFVVFDNPVPEDKDFRLKEVESLLKTGYSSINEQRQRDGLEPVSWGEEPLMPMNIAPLGTMAAVEPPPMPPKYIESTVHKALPPAEQATNFIDKSFVAAMKRYFKELKADILKGFDEDADELEKGLVNSGRYHTAKANPNDFAAGWFNMQKWNKKLVERAEPFLNRTMMAGGERALKRLPTNTIFDPINPEVTKALEMHREGIIHSVNGTTSKKLRMSLAAGMEAKETAGVLRSRVAKVFDDLSKYGAERIARTETIWAWNAGAVEGYKQSGIVTKKVWVSSNDERACDYCPTLDGKVVDVEAVFFHKGDKMPNPNVEGAGLDFSYEEVGHPPLHPNCRCAIAPQTEEF